METTPMTSVSVLNKAPTEIAIWMQGTIASAQIAHPDVLHVEFLDPTGDRWFLATQDAEWSPADPTKLVGRSIESTDLDPGSGTLQLGLSEGVKLVITPAARDSDDDPPNWELFSPNGGAIEFGPGLRMSLRSSESPASHAA
jgi:hypothetical protein